MAGPLSAFAEFERKILRVYLCAGSAYARKQGTRLDRRRGAQKQWKPESSTGQGSSRSEIARQLQIS